MMTAGMFHVTNLTPGSANPKLRAPREVAGGPRGADEESGRPAALPGLHGGREGLGTAFVCCRARRKMY
jgi:hypothetical protein